MRALAPSASSNSGPPHVGGPFYAVDRISEACMENPAGDIARRLGREAEAVCRHYLSNGRRQGRY